MNTQPKETQAERDSTAIMLAGFEINNLRRKAEAEGNELLARALWTASHALGSISFSSAKERKAMKQYAINEAHRYRKLRIESMLPKKAS